MKKRVVAACLAAVLGIAPCSVGASQESEVQCISETESSDNLVGNLYAGVSGNKARSV